jgi:predicted flap endonuclease-1-like 5' DNA nuclease
MLYLFGQILFWIALTLAAGIALGWYLRGIIRGDAYQEMAMKEVKFERPARTVVSHEPSITGTVLNDALMKAQRELEACQQSLAIAEARLKSSPAPAAQTLASMSSSAEASTLTGTAPGPVMRKASSAASKKMPVSDRDDLKKIYGIGPVIERRLAEIEITTYRQIARLTAAEIDRIGEHLNYFPGRIERDGWLDSARRLHQDKYGEMP